MKKNLLFAAACCMLLASCAQKPEKSIHLYAWDSVRHGISEEVLETKVAELESHGVEGILISAGGYDVETHTLCAKLAHKHGMEYHAWVPTMLNATCDPSWYAINREGASAYDTPVYASHYHFLCPTKPEVQDYLIEQYSKIAAIEDVDYVHLDFIRYPDVILPVGLWEKYGLVQHEEYAPADYCYCDHCVADFKEKYGIDIKAMEDPSQCQEWKQYRYDVITDLVSKIADQVHSQGKKLSSAVFPGPTLSMKLVRQEWDKWTLDKVFPMNYNDFYLEGASWLKTICEEESAAAGNTPVYSGLFICPDWQNKASHDDPEDHGLLPSEMEEAILGSLAGGATGVCLFTPSRMSAEHWAALDATVEKYKKQ